MHATIPGVMDTQLAALTAMNDHLKDEMHSEQLEHDEQIELMKLQLAEMSRERTWEMAACEERSERLASEKAEMLIETDELLDYHDYLTNSEHNKMQSEQNKSAEIVSEANELRAATDSQARQLAVQAAELTSARSEVTNLRDQIARLQAERDEALEVTALGHRPLVAKETPEVLSEDSQEELEVINEKLKVAHSEIAGLEDECGESNKKAEKAAIENAGLRTENERLRLELSEAVDKAAINGERLEGEVERLQNGKLMAAKAEEAAVEIERLQTACRGEVEKLQAAKTVSASLRAEVKRLEDALIEATAGSDADNASLRSEILKMTAAMEKQSEIVQEKTQKLEASQDREINTQLKLEAIRLEKEQLVEARAASRPCPPRAPAPPRKRRRLEAEFGAISELLFRGDWKAPAGLTLGVFAAKFVLS